MPLDCKLSVCFLYFRCCGIVLDTLRHNFEREATWISEQFKKAYQPFVIVIAVDVAELWPFAELVIIIVHCSGKNAIDVANGAK